MSLRALFVFISLCLFCRNQVRADAGPFRYLVLVDIAGLDIDSVCLLQGDTARHCGCRGEVCLRFDGERQRVQVGRLIPAQFRLELHTGQGSVLTPVLYRSGNLTTYMRMRYDSGVWKEETPFVGLPWSSYLWALGLTLLLELLTAWLFFARASSGKLLRVLGVVFGVNVLSHPLLYWATARQWLEFLPGEGWVLVLETLLFALLLRGRVSLGRSIALILLANFVSFFFGGLILLMGGY